MNCVAQFARSRWAFARFFVASVILLSISPGRTLAEEMPSLPEAVAKRLELIDLLKAEKFDELEGRIATMFAETKEGKPAPWAKRSVMYAFMRADPGIARALAHWRKAYPESFAPHLAFGLYSTEIGWAMRGTEFSSLTNPKRLEEMHTYFDAADDAMRTALQLRPRLEIAWAMLIDLAKVRGKKKEMVSHLNEAISHLPNHSLVYETYFHAIAPKWGGSAKQRLALKIRILADYPADPKFAWIDDQEEVEAAWRKYRDQDYATALAMFRKLVSAHDTSERRNGLALSLGAVGKLKEAIVQFERARDLDPANAQRYADLAEIQERYPELWEEARRNYHIAVALEPYNPRFLSLKAQFLINDGKLESAKQDLDRALFFGAFDDAVHDGLRIYYLAAGDTDAAVEEAEKMVSLVPRNPRNHYFYGITLYQNQDCRSGQVLKRYLGACRNGAECWDHEIGHAELIIQQLKFSCG